MSDILPFQANRATASQSRALARQQKNALASIDRYEVDRFVDTERASIDIAATRRASGVALLSELSFFHEFRDLVMDSAVAMELFARRLEQLQQMNSQAISRHLG